MSYASRAPDYHRVPAVMMKGQWLEVAGFATGTKIEVRVVGKLSVRRGVRLGSLLG